MSNLYGPRLSKIFDKIYQGFIDYKVEYDFYAHLCHVNNVQSILELGCGTGNLANYFSKDFDEYLGLDYSEHMLSIARKKFPNGNFIQGDMRNFNLVKKFDTALITGRSTSYLLTKEDLLNTFTNVFDVLNPKGCLIFDCIDASKFIPYIQKNPSVIHKSKFENIEYSRTSEWYSKEKDPKTIQWAASYYKQKGTTNQFLGKDNISFKVFTVTEITTALNKSGFEVMNIIDRPSYAFDTFVVVAKKTK